jgi:hypothetical protein
LTTGFEGPHAVSATSGIRTTSEKSVLRGIKRS